MRVHARFLLAWHCTDAMPPLLRTPLGSNRYHLLHPSYVLPRLKALSRGFRLLVLLVHVDSEEAVKPLRELTKIAVGLDATLVCGFSNEVGACARCRWRW